MSSISWNCRGIGLPLNIQFLKEVVGQEKPVFIFLCETLARKDKMEWVRVQLGFEGLFAVDPIGRIAGIALLWKERDQTKLISFSQNHIDVEVMIEGMNKWSLLGVYGEPN